ncbi:phosphoribosylglycinamide formyltransferase [Virgibacillus sp. W0430]|uniref:phosphoribosylglycinamide formyltransferase n=1 Tax=Virgibacillus sp. W0430 TaxID=3391580 RepID=UPI003F47F34C
MRSIRAAVFASGTGSNFEAIMREGNLGCDIKLLVCDQPEAQVIEKAAAFSVPTYVAEPKKFASKEAYESSILRRLQEEEITWVFLAGYMRMIGKTLLDSYEGKIINIHPSLLPAFPGIDAIGQAYQAGVKKTGVTVHYVDEGMDTGPIIAQEEVEILPNDTIDSLKTRIQAIEHRLYSRVIKKLVKRDE